MDEDGEAFTHAEREKNARAAEAAGWQLVGKGLRGVWRSPVGSLGGLPRFGSDPAAARALLEALKPEQQAQAVAKLIDRLEIDPGTYSGLVGLLLAPPAAIRDAVLEAVEGREE
jgi:hypothetical protein